MELAEKTLNVRLADLLRTTRREWDKKGVLQAEPNGSLADNSRVPDIMINESRMPPLIIETEVEPALTVEKDAIAKLGQKTRNRNRKINVVIAVKMPSRLRSVEDGKPCYEMLKAANDFSFRVFSKPADDSDKFFTWPPDGWIVGGYRDISRTAQQVSMPDAVVELASDRLAKAIECASDCLIAQDNGNVLVQSIGNLLKQAPNAQTVKMAMAIVANTFISHELLAGSSEELSHVRHLTQLSSGEFGISQMDVIREWQKIRKINYLPIFDVAINILLLIPSNCVREILEHLTKSAQDLVERGWTKSHDVTGAVFQRLITDRQFLAAFYTTPAAATLLSSLTVDFMVNSDPDHENDRKIQNIKIGDFACGTGTLLSHAYQRICQNLEMTGGNAADHHTSMMERQIIGCDILPSASHLTASMLTNFFPEKTYRRGGILALPYGVVDGKAHLGSYELLEKPDDSSISKKNNEITASENIDVSSESAHACRDNSFDIVLMNPPFTRNTNHESSNANVENPLFAAFGTSAINQKILKKRFDALTRSTCYNGYAGAASAFLAIAETKLKEGGVMGMILPLSLMAGDSWNNGRDLLVKHFEDLCFISICGMNNEGFSFSADTSMGEIMVIGKKSSAEPSARAVFVNLYNKLETLHEATVLADVLRKIASSKKIRQLSDRPVGATLIEIGGKAVGTMVSSLIALEDTQWPAARVFDMSLGQLAHHMCTSGVIWPLGAKEPLPVRLPIRKLSSFAQIGPVHRSVSDTKKTTYAPFRKAEWDGTRPSTYPMLSNHSCERERTLEFSGDSEGIAKQGTSVEEEIKLGKRIDEIAGTASYAHFNLDFRFNSNSTSMQITPNLTIGGRAWPSVKIGNLAHEKCLVLWANSSLGLLLHWWQVSKVQSGRGCITVRPLKEFKAFDVTQLSQKQIDAGVRLFDEIKNRKLLPFNEIETDSVRDRIDQEFLLDILEIGLPKPEAMLILSSLRKRLAYEPTVQGGKKKILTKRQKTPNRRSGDIEFT